MRVGFFNLGELSVSGKRFQAMLEISDKTLLENIGIIQERSMQLIKDVVNDNEDYLSGKKVELLTNGSELVTKSNKTKKIWNKFVALVENPEWRKIEDVEISFVKTDQKKLDGTTFCYQNGIYELRLPEHIEKKYFSFIAFQVCQLIKKASLREEKVPISIGMGGIDMGSDVKSYSQETKELWNNLALLIKQQHTMTSKDEMPIKDLVDLLLTDDEKTLIKDKEKLTLLSEKIIKNESIIDEEKKIIDLFKLDENTLNPELRFCQYLKESSAY